EGFIGAFAFATGVGGRDPEVVGRARRQASDHRRDRHAARAAARGWRARGARAVAGAGAVFELAFGDLEAVGVDRRVEGARGLAHPGGRFGFDGGLDRD